MSKFSELGKISRPIGLDICMARDANASLLVKLVVEFRHGTNKLSVDNLSHKYTLGPHILSHSRTTFDSLTWNFIIKPKNVLKDGFYYV
jgi:hypothetical protein